MADRIRILPGDIVDKISAGEVIERPASVVKELVENSVDAGAGKIIVDVSRGGMDSLSVADNGCGMSSADALLCFRRHSTSKIKNAGDIEKILTLGFRGEALPSIASVSKMRITTRGAGEASGMNIILEGGELKLSEPAGAPPGTRVQVENLFYNTPARRKFLKTPSTEIFHISGVVNLEALARADIHFELIHNGSLLLRTPPAAQLGKRLLYIFGSEIEEHLLHFEEESGGIKLKGALCKPDYSRSRNDRMLFFVNNRPVRSRLISHAATEAFHPLVPGGRFPFIVLFVEMDPRLVDVNVHPRKTEVKFLDQGPVHDSILRAVKKAAGGESSVPSMFVRPGEPGLKKAAEQAVFNYLSENRPAFIHRSPPPRAAGEPALRDNEPPPPGMRAVAQLHNLYIVAEARDEIVIIDQHAAHERILFEKIKADLHGGKMLKQRLLSPSPIETERSEAVFINAHTSLLDRAGFELEAFGDNTFILRTVPAVLENADPATLFFDVVSDLIETGEAVKVSQLETRLISLISCRGAVKAGDRLSREEMESLVEGLDRLDSRTSCPHGRPSMVRIHLGDMAKKFRRPK